MKPVAILLAAGVLCLAACDRPAPRERKVAVPPVGVAEAQARRHRPLTPIKPQRVAPPAPLTWSAESAAFEFQGKPLRAEKLWRFDGSTDGFVAAGGEVQPLGRGGMRYRLVRPDPILRSPKGLNVDGHTRTLVIVRLTRVLPGEAWDGTLFYSTAAHGESAAFRAKPVFGAPPQPGETSILVFDMQRLQHGGADWSSSIIEQIRIDLDDSPGGEFLIHQVTIAADPGLPVQSPSAEPSKPVKASAG